MKKEVKIGVTATLMEWMTAHPQKAQILISEIEDAVHMTAAVFKRAPDSKIRALCAHMVVDKEIKNALTKAEQKPSCKRGCSYCCYLSVDITADEADLILAHLQKENRTLDWDRLERQAAVQDFRTLSHEDKRCTFLGKEGECTIYDVRPLNCRKYLVVGDPKDCETGITTEGARVNLLVAAKAEVYTSAVFSIMGSARMANILLRLRK